jgi:UDP-glucose 4-epimerase
MKILVTGAAGYIGSVLTEKLVKEGHSVIALDNLKGGHEEAVSHGATFIQADLANSEELNNLLKDYQIEAVMHLAADALVEESMANPRKYFQTNTVYGMNLLDAMQKQGVNRIIFSSTAAVYGNPESIPVKESDFTRPVNAYGDSKIMFEKILHWYSHAYGLQFVILRYFNAAGASEYFGEDHNPETHLIPNFLKVALGQRNHVPIFGVDYDTKDGSCVRDYIHVLDIAKAHMLALNNFGTEKVNRTYNLGNGEGYSVLEVIETARKVTGTQIPTSIHPRRTGDPPILIASSDLARSELGWQPEYYELESIIGSAWRWQKTHPQGYVSR